VTTSARGYPTGPVLGLILSLAGPLLVGCGVAGTAAPLPVLAGAGQSPPARPSSAPTTHAAATAPPSIDGAIAFSRGHDIWVYAGSEARQLTQLGAVQNPAWSPDATELAFDRAGKNSADIWLMSYPDGAPRAITTNGAPHVDANFWEMQPAWSPDGTALVYASDRGRARSGTLDLAAWQMTIAGTARRQLSAANPYTGGIDYPSWRPSGSQILYTSWTYLPNDTDAYGHLELLDVRANRTWALTQPGQTAMQASWAPGGARIAFIRRSNGQDQVWLAAVPFVLGKDADVLREAQLLEDGVNAHPAWSPRGDAIAYIGFKDGSFDLFVQPLTVGMGPDGPPRQLTHGARLDADSAISWSH
jgi:Tol biopolymer transport system component